MEHTRMIPAAGEEKKKTPRADLAQGHTAWVEPNGAQSGNAEMRERAPETAERRRFGRADVPFLSLTLIILVIGVVMVLSASYVRAVYSDKSTSAIFARQLVFAVLGVIGMLAASLVPERAYRSLAIPSAILSAVLLAAVLVFGVRENGAKRWLDLGITTFQPSELAKLAVVLSFSALSCRYGREMKTFRKGVLPFAGILLVFCGLLAAEPHISACIILVCVGFVMLYLGGTKPGYLLLGLLAAALGALLAYYLLDYVQTRVQVWRDPASDAYGDGFQVLQSLYAVGSGGLFGRGLGQSRQKYLYLPEEHNDFIFSVVCEELGYVGAVLILILYALLIIRGFWLAVHASSRFAGLVTAGLMVLLSVQVFLNVAVVTNLLPCTGISLPFFSYGGTALVIQLFEMGIVLRFSRNALPEGRPGRAKPDDGEPDKGGTDE